MGGIPTPEGGDNYSLEARFQPFPTGFFLFSGREFPVHKKRGIFGLKGGDYD
jgi:hypothetical protein